MTFTSIQLAAIRNIAEKYGVAEMEATEQKGIFLDAKTRIIVNCKVTSKEKEFKGLPEIGITDMKGFTDENAGGQTVDDIRDDIRSALKALPKEKSKPRVEFDSKTGRGEAPKPSIAAEEVKLNGNVKEITIPSKEEPEKSIPQIHNEEQDQTPVIVKKDEIKTEAKIENKAPEKQEVKHDEKHNQKAQEVSKADTKPAEAAKLPDLKKTIPVKMCRVCGYALDPARAMECFEKDMQEPLFICVGCEAKKPSAHIPEVMPPEHKGNTPPARGIPIKTVSTKGLMIKNFVPKCAEIGGIRIGMKGESKTSQAGGVYRQPEKLDHFIVTTPNKDNAGNFIMDDVMKTLPENPTKLDIMLLYDDETMNFSTQYREMKGGRIVCSGDGEKAFDKELGREIVCDIDTCPKYEKKKCKLNGTLSVILLNKPTIGGVYRFRTTGWNSVQSIMTSMLMIKTLTRGLLAMIPLTLTLTPKLVTPKGMDKAHTIYFVNIEYHGTDLLEQVLKLSNHRMAMQSEIKKLETQSLLLAPESEEELKDIQEEFYPGVK